MDSNFPELTNKQLINMCLLNDEDAWQEFFHRHEPPIQKSIILEFVIKIKFSKLTNEQLINMCLLDIQEAWNEFFYRYTDDIKETIIRIFLDKRHYHLAKDEEVVEDIFLDVFDQVWREKGLSTLKNPNYCKLWLRKITFSKTMDWFRKRNLVKNRSENQGERSTRSLDTPLNQEDSRTLQDIIEDPNSIDPYDDRDIKNELAEYLNELKALTPKEHWALRIKLMFYDSITKEDITELSGFAKMPPEEISKRLDNISKDLLKKNAAKEKDREAAGNVHADIIHSQKILFENKSNPDFQKDEIIDEINRKNERLEALRKSSSVLVEPSNEQVAAIMGIPKERALAVSLLVYRAREKIKKRISQKKITFD
jgi:DNA-directed RNA polymerase specialized sigma24 family protein